MFYVDDALAGAGDYGFRAGFANPLDTVLVMGGQNIESNVRFDNIAVVVPEPGTVALFLGGCALLIGCWRSRRS